MNPYFSKIDPSATVEQLKKQAENFFVAAFDQKLADPINYDKVDHDHLTDGGNLCLYMAQVKAAGFTISQ